MSKYTVVVNIREDQSGKETERVETLFDTKSFAERIAKHANENYGYGHFDRTVTGRSYFYTTEAKHSKSFKNPSIALLGKENSVTIKAVA